MPIKDRTFMQYVCDLQEHEPRKLQYLVDHFPVVLNECDDPESFPPELHIIVVCVSADLRALAQRDESHTSFFASYVGSFRTNAPKLREILEFMPASTADVHEMGFSNPACGDLLLYVNDSMTACLAGFECMATDLLENRASDGLRPPLRAVDESDPEEFDLPPDDLHDE